MKCGLTEHRKRVKKEQMFPSGIEPETFCVLGRCDNRYTTETVICSISLQILATVENELAQHREREKQFIVWGQTGDLLRVRQM
jgi:hypothetical protein